MSHTDSIISIIYPLLVLLVVLLVLFLVLLQLWNVIFKMLFLHTEKQKYITFSYVCACNKQTYMWINAVRVSV